MAMITCPECGKDISDQASQCPYCGYPLRRKKAAQKLKSKKKSILITVIAVLAMVVVVGALVFVLSASQRASQEKASRLIPYQTVGGYVTFGTYPQTESGTDQTPIEWLVLEYDAKNNRALLLSRYGLDAKPYNTEWVDITWEQCTLRKWLNGEFLNKAFSGKEQGAILTTTVDNGDSQGFDFAAVNEYAKYAKKTNGGNNTQDKVFLLSYAEANRYLNVTIDNRNNMESRVSPTAYAVKNRAGTISDNKTVEGVAAGYWWLRSPGGLQDHAAVVSADGALRSGGVSGDFVSVRPALWINLESDIF